jgi:hypothetical protein
MELDGDIEGLTDELVVVLFPTSKLSSLDAVAEVDKPP